jgi:hypothetical protein
MTNAAISTATTFWFSKSTPMSVKAKKKHEKAENHPLHKCPVRNDVQYHRGCTEDGANMGAIDEF